MRPSPWHLFQRLLMLDILSSTDFLPPLIVPTPLTITGGSCHKLFFVATKVFFCPDETLLFRDKSMFGATKRLSRQNYICRDKCKLLSRQKWYLHNFVVTKAIFCRDKRVKPVLNWTNVCSPNILRTVRRTMIRFLIELLVRRTWFGQFDELYFVFNWLVMRCKLRTELAADAQQTA